MTYKFILNHEIIRGRPGLTLYTGNQSAYRFEFSFDKEWDGMQKFITFSDGDNTYVLPLINDSALVPSELLCYPGSFFFGLYATGEAEEIKRVSSNIINVTVMQGAYSNGTKPTEPTKELWEKLVSKSVPIIGDNGNWMFWDFAADKYVDSEKLAVPQHDDTYILNRIDQLEEKNAEKQDLTNRIINTETAADITLADNTEFIFKSSLNSLAVTLPRSTAEPYIASVVFDSGKPATKFIPPSDGIFYQGADCTETDFSPSADKHYTMIFTYDTSQTVCYVSAVPTVASATFKSMLMTDSNLSNEASDVLGADELEPPLLLPLDYDEQDFQSTAELSDIQSESSEITKSDIDTEVI